MIVKTCSTMIYYIQMDWYQAASNVSNNYPVTDGGCPNLNLSHSVNSSPPSAAYMRQRIGSAMVQIMACRLFGAKPLSKLVLGCCQLHPFEQNSMKFYKIQNFSFTKMHLKIPSLCAAPWASCQIRKTAGCACAGNAGNVFPASAG